MAAIRMAREASWGPEVEFPQTGTIGPAVGTIKFDKGFALFTADADGGLYWLKDKFSPEKMLERLFTFSDTSRSMDHPEQPSNVNVIIRADRSAPWSATRTLLDACAHPAVRVYRVHFAVESETDGEPGTLATFLPIAFAPQDHPQHKKRELPGQVQVNLSLENGSPPSLAGLFDALYALDPAWRSVPAMVRPAADVPTETALRAFDLLLRAGARSAFFGPPPNAGTPAGVNLNGVPCVSGDDSFAPLPVFRSKRAVGVTDPPPLDSPADEGR